MIGRPDGAQLRLSRAARRPLALAMVALAGLIGLLPSLVPAGSAARQTAGRGARSAALGLPAWSPPATLAAGCALVGGPQVAFPSAAPQVPTGPGGIVWASDPSRCGGSAGGVGGSSSTVVVAPLGSDEQPQGVVTRPLEGAFSGELAAVGATFGRLAIAAGMQAVGAPVATATVLQGRAMQPLGPPAFAEQGSRFALTRAYLGDVAIASVRRTAIAVRVERHYLSGFGPTRLVPISRGPVSALVAAMDFRSDVLLAWQQNGAIYAEMLRSAGRSDPVQRLGASAPDPQLQALVSDNDHGVVAWSSPSASAPASRTRTYIDLSSAGVRFGAPRLLASFADPAGAGSSPGSLALERLSSENAVVAWTDAEKGHYVVRSSATAFAGTRPATALSDASGQAVLAALAPGPDGEADAFWTSPPSGASTPGAPRTELWGARTFVVPHDRVALSPAQMIASPGELEAVSAGVNPADDRAVVAWLTRGQPSLQYAVSGAAPGPASLSSRAARPAARRATSSGAPWLPITLAAAGVGAALLARGANHRRRAHRGRRR